MNTRYASCIATAITRLLEHAFHHELCNLANAEQLKSLLPPVSTSLQRKIKKTFVSAADLNSKNWLKIDHCFSVKEDGPFARLPHLRFELRSTNSSLPGLCDNKIIDIFQAVIQKMSDTLV
eukprot:COSAG02_NODE_1529_length_12087_cov_326.174258_1_plen_121_part_00